MTMNRSGVELRGRRFRWWFLWCLCLISLMIYRFGLAESMGGLLSGDWIGQSLDVIKYYDVIEFQALKLLYSMGHYHWVGCWCLNLIFVGFDGLFWFSSIIEVKMIMILIYTTTFILYYLISRNKNNNFLINIV